MVKDPSPIYLKNKSGLFLKTAVCLYISKQLIFVNTCSTYSLLSCKELKHKKIISAISNTWKSSEQHSHFALTYLAYDTTYIRHSLICPKKYIILLAPPQTASDACFNLALEGLPLGLHAHSFLGQYNCDFWDPSTCSPGTELRPFSSHRYYLTHLVCLTMVKWFQKLTCFTEFNVVIEVKNYHQSLEPSRSPQVTQYWTPQPFLETRLSEFRS